MPNLKEAAHFDNHVMARPRQNFLLSSNRRPFTNEYIDPKNKANDPEYWKRQLAEGEAKLAASEKAEIQGAVVAQGVVRTSSIALFLSGVLGGLALLRLRAEPQ